MTEASAVLRDQCIGRQECFPDFNKGFNGYDPCPFYVKWMDAKWDCGTLSDTYKGELILMNYFMEVLIYIYMDEGLAPDTNGPLVYI